MAAAANSNATTTYSRNFAYYTYLPIWPGHHVCCQAIGYCWRSNALVGWQWTCCNCARRIAG